MCFVMSGSVANFIKQRQATAGLLNKMNTPQLKKGFVFLPLLIFSIIVPAQPDFPYHRNKKDFILVPLAILTKVSSEVLRNKYDRSLSIDEIAALDRYTINGFDRGATYNWSTTWEKVSDVPSLIIPFFPIALGVPMIKNKKYNNALTLGLMYVEVSIFRTGITGSTKSLTGRIRPYLYNTSFTLQERFDLQKDSPTATSSFISGHASNAFAFAVFFSKTFTDIYGKNTWSKIIWSGSLILATTTAVARVKAGVHFPTDVIAGALVGSAIGYAIPVLHKVNPEKLSLSILPGYFMMAYTL